MITFDKCSRFKGSLTVPSDKSITHRAIIMSAMASGISAVRNPLISRDTLATINAFKAAGTDIIVDSERLVISSSGYAGFKEPADIVNCDNSGTTARLLCGVFAPRPFCTVLSGDDSLRKRPMGRVIKPLSALGADIRSRAGNTLLPAVILPSSALHGASLKAETKSAQVKSAVLLAAAQINGFTSYSETVSTRDHTERMLKNYGVRIEVAGREIRVDGGYPMTPSECFVPGDFSSAAFFIAAALAFEGSEITVRNCGLNPSRTGFLKALESLGVKIETEILVEAPEPVGNVYVKYSPVRGGKISGDVVANAIDEIPALAFTALFGEGPVEIRDASELRVKESDRISALAENFSALGARVEEFEDGLKIYPLEKVPSKTVLKSFGDHRICMVNILIAKKYDLRIIVDSVDALDVSFPNFIDKITDLEEK